MKKLIDESKTEILTAMKSDKDEIVNKLSYLIKRVDELEKKNTQLEKRCAQLETKSNDSAMFFLNEMEDRLRRRKSLVISGLPEQVKGTVDERHKADSNGVKALIQNLCMGTTDAENSITRIHRIGRQEKEKHRLVRVVLDEDDAKAILRKAKDLRDSSKYDKIFINPDLTPFQREISKKLRDELKRRRIQGEEVIIRSGKIIPKTQPQNFR